ncbi:phosphotriesterase family protein [Alloiococcus sp. CFN-8]|uniref:phosphotriesterase family protein n=1 Tax=Alloiococcus sp. CFN-8 TaxID=3416081 RepID=UPI003CF382C8
MNLKEGMTYSHEHVAIDLSGVKKNEDCRLDCFQDTLAEFIELKSKGVGNIIELTNRGMGRDVPYMEKMAEKSGLNILFATGFYKEPFLPPEGYSLNEKELAELMIEELEVGIEGSESKASIIGEIGSSKDEITPIERKIFNASCRAHIETGAPIITHTTLGTMALEQIEIFKEYQVDLDRVIISHVDLSGSLDYILRIIDKGVNVAFDTIGKENYQPDGLRIDMLKEIDRRGLSEKVLLSMDITRKSAFKHRGGPGYAYLLDTFLPALREVGVSHKAIENMTDKNIRRIVK